MSLQNRIILVFLVVITALVGAHGATRGPHHVFKRTSDTDPLTRPQNYPNCSNEGEVFPQQLKNDSIPCQTVWICHNKQWIARNLLTAYGKTKSLPGKSCKDIQDKLSEPCISKLYNLYKTGVFWVKVKDPCTGEEESIQVYCDFNFNGGGWNLVWKHSYVEVTPTNSSMFWYSDFYKPCLDLNSGSNGWCNIPRKIRFNPQETLIVAYHNKKKVYAYKGGFNRNIDYHWTGTTLFDPVRIVDHCTRSSSQGVAPYPQKKSAAITGLALAKWPSNGDTDTIDGHGTDDDRWEQCQLPSFISSAAQSVQMTVAIFVR